MLKHLRALALGLSVGLGEALAPARVSLPEPAFTQRSRGKGKGNAPAAPRWFGKRIRTVSAHKRDPNSPVLAAAIAKRERRAAALGDSASRSWNSNAAHSGERLNPFYINREV